MVQYTPTSPCYSSTNVVYDNLETERGIEREERNREREGKEGKVESEGETLGKTSKEDRARVFSFVLNNIISLLIRCIMMSNMFFDYGVSSQ